VIVADRRLVRSAGKVMALVVIAPEGEVDKVLSAAPGPYNERRGGTGLSLPIAHRAIQRAGGRLWAPACSSDDDRGLRSAAVVAVPVSD
jgi:hypothetical protein